MQTIEAFKLNVFPNPSVILKTWLICLDHKRASTLETKSPDTEFKAWICLLFHRNQMQTKIIIEIRVLIVNKQLGSCTNDTCFQKR